MTPVPDVKPLPHGHRKFVFITSLLVFLIAVPTFVFYAVGYRFDFSGTERNIMSVGGMYVTAEAEETEIFIDDEPVEDMRIFQRAAYIQNLSEGTHQVHVQGSDLQTWVKELPVFPHYVTEASSFNMPERPQVRLVTEYTNTDGAIVLTGSTSTSPLAFASSTQVVFLATTTATSTYTANTEYPYIETRFASSSAELQLMRDQKYLLEQPFGFSEDRASATVAVATTTKEYRDTRLLEKDGEVYIQWLGDEDDIPYYYCVRYEDATTTAGMYGDHVEKAVVLQTATAFAANNEILTETEMRGERYCRSEIRIDRTWQEVQWFDYYPGSRDLILMHLEDGLYVTEVDDRAWQNTQQIYPGTGLEVVRDGDRIFVHDGDYFLEVFTELLEAN